MTSSLWAYSRTPLKKISNFFTDKNNNVPATLGYTLRNLLENCIPTDKTEASVPGVVIKKDNDDNLTLTIGHNKVRINKKNGIKYTNSNGDEIKNILTIQTDILTPLNTAITASLLQGSIEYNSLITEHQRLATIKTVFDTIKTKDPVQNPAPAQAQQLGTNKVYINLYDQKNGQNQKVIVLNEDYKDAGISCFDVITYDAKSEPTKAFRYSNGKFFNVDAKGNTTQISENDIDGELTALGTALVGAKTDAIADITEIYKKYTSALIKSNATEYQVQALTQLSNTNQTNKNSALNTVDKYYRGLNKKNTGYGQLYDIKENTRSIGFFENGTLIKGKTIDDKENSADVKSSRPFTDSCDFAYNKALRNLGIEGGTSQLTIHLPNNCSKIVNVQNPLDFSKKCIESLTSALGVVKQDAKYKHSKFLKSDKLAIFLTSIIKASIEHPNVSHSKEMEIKRYKAIFTKLHKKSIEPQDDDDIRHIVRLAKTIISSYQKNAEKNGLQLNDNNGLGHKLGYIPPKMVNDIVIGAIAEYKTKIAPKAQSM